MEDLKPCPFCGSENVVIEYDDPQDVDTNCFVKCIGCFSTSDTCWETETAIAMWNARPEALKKG